jgi:hypothetical protein
MRITKENIDNFLGGYLTPGSKDTLDISLKEIGGKITHIDYLPGNLKILHLGNYCTVETLPVLGDHLSHFTCGNGTLKMIPNLPESLMMIDLRRTALPEVLRSRFNVDKERIINNMEEELVKQQEFKENFALLDLINKI